MSTLYPGGNGNANADHASSSRPSQPSRLRTRSQVPSSPETTYGHYPPAPHTYPIVPFEDAPQTPQPTQPDAYGQHVNNIASGSALLTPEPTPELPIPPKRPAADPVQPPNAKRVRKPKKGTTRPSAESLQGIGPIPPELAASEDHPLPPSPVTPKPQQPKNASTSPWWACVYSVDSGDKPATPYIPDGPLLSEKPDSTHLACVACNKSQSVLMPHLLYIQLIS
jgi:hypothetical protein